MEKEEKEVFPYIDALLKGKQVKPVAIDMSLLHRSPIEKKLSELRELIIKFYDINAVRVLSVLSFLCLSLLQKKRLIKTQQRMRAFPAYPKR